MKPTSKKIRALLADCCTEEDIIIAFRLHKIRYGFTTETGVLCIKVPTRTGSVRIFHSAARAPRYTADVVPGYRCPVLHPDY